MGKAETRLPHAFFAGAGLGGEAPSDGNLEEKLSSVETVVIQENETIDREDGEVDLRVLLEKTFGQLTETCLSDLCSELASYWDTIPTDGNDARVKEANHFHNLMEGGLTARQSSLLERITSQVEMNDFASKNGSWFDEVHYHPWHNLQFSVKCEWIKANACLWVTFNSERQLSEGFKRTTGIEIGKAMVIPSFEVLALMVEALLPGSKSMKEVFQIMRKKVWFGSRRTVCFLARFVKSRRLKLEQSAEPQRGKAKRAEVSGLEEILKRHKVSPQAFHDIMECMRGMEVEAPSMLPPSAMLKPQGQPSLLPTNPVFLGGEQAETWEERVAYLMLPESKPELVEEFRRLFVKTETANDLLEKGVLNPHTGKALGKGRLLGNILAVDNWSNPTRPTNFLGTCIMAGLQGKNAVQVGSEILQRLLQLSSCTPDIEDKAKKLRKLPRASGKEAEWFSHRTIDQRRTSELQKRILNPLDLHAVPVSGEGQLCMVRTFAFLLFMVEGRLPPFCWRLTACMALVSFLFLGDEQVCNKATIYSPTEGSLDMAIREMCGGDSSLQRKFQSIAMELVRGDWQTPEAQDPALMFNDSLIELVKEFFAKKNAESKREYFELMGGLGYDIVQLFPAMTGKPFLIIRTVGSVTDEAGELDYKRINDRDATQDTVPVFDVIHVTPNGERQACTYGSYQEAQAGLGNNTPYQAFWTGLPTLSHMDPVIPDHEYQVLTSYIRK